MAIHKTSNGYEVDIQPGGRTGTRIRRTFLYQSDAIAFEKKVIADWQRGEYLDKGKRSAMPFPAYVDLYIDRYVNLRMKNPERSEIYRLVEFKAFFEKALGEISHEDGERWMEFEKKRGSAPGTINRKLVSLKRIFAWALDRGDLNQHPLRRLKKLKIDGGRVVWLTKPQVDQLIRIASEIDPPMVPIIQFGVNTGFRKSNIEAFNADKDWNGKFVTALKTKSGQPYDVPVNDALEELSDVIKSLNVKNIGVRFRKISRAAGYWYGTRDPRNVTLHTLRHTFIAHCLQSGVPIYTVSKWAGHASSKITEQVYGHLSKTHHTDEIRKFPGLGL